MPLKFRLRGLAETFIDRLICPKCGRDGGSSGDEGFETKHTKVTFDGIVVVANCQACNTVFVPNTQRMGILCFQRLRQAIEYDSKNTGLPIFCSIDDVRNEVEKINLAKNSQLH